MCKYDGCLLLQVFSAKAHTQWSPCAPPLLLPSLPPLPGPLSQEKTASWGLDKVKRNIMNVLVSQPDGRVALQDLEGSYQECNTQTLDVSQIQDVSSTAELIQRCKPELEVGHSRGVGWGRRVEGMGWGG